MKFREMLLKVLNCRQQKESKPFIRNVSEKKSRNRALFWQEF